MKQSKSQALLAIGSALVILSLGYFFVVQGMEWRPALVGAVIGYSLAFFLHNTWPAQRREAKLMRGSGRMRRSEARAMSGDNPCLDHNSSVLAEVYRGNAIIGRNTGISGDSSYSSGGTSYPSSGSGSSGGFCTSSSSDSGSSSSGGCSGGGSD